MVNPVDRLVGWLDPQRGLRRLHHRQLLQRAYEGASRKDGWRPKRSGASANADHQADARELRIRARSLVQNVPYINQAVRAKVAQVVGDGIKPRSKAKSDRARKAYDQAWADSVEFLDADGRLDIYAFTAAAYRCADVDGEVLVRIRPRRLGDGLRVPVQFQLLEIDWLDSQRTEKRGANAVINGIEYDWLGRVFGYWLFDEHPGEAAGFLVRRRSTSHFVPAASIVHYYNPERPGQGRGFSSLAPVIARVRDVQLLEDAELARKNTETRYGAMVSGDASLLANSVTDLQQPGDTAAAARTGDLGQLPSGALIQVPDGVNITMAEPKAAPGFEGYIKLNLHIVAAGYGVTYEMMTGDVAEVNFSSARVRLLDVRREYEVTQWTLLIPKLLAPMWRAFVDACELAGIVDAPDYNVDWSTPKWDYVNPEQDVKADLAEISGGLSTISEKLRRRGYKPDEVFAELKRDFDSLRDLGVLDILLFLQKGSAPDASAEQQKTSANKRMLEDIARVLDRMETRLVAIEQRDTVVNVRAGDTTVQQAPAPVVNVEGSRTDVHVPAQLPASVTVEGARVDVHVPQQDAPVVNVQAAPAEVRIVNEVQPADVNVTLPARKTVTDIERDKAGRITRATQRED